MHALMLGKIHIKQGQERYINSYINVYLHAGPCQFDGVTTNTC